jgi:hypothetical protein
MKHQIPAQLIPATGWGKVEPVLLANGEPSGRWKITIDYDSDRDGRSDRHRPPSMIALTAIRLELQSWLRDHFRSWDTFTFGIGPRVGFEYIVSLNDHVGDQ